MSEFSQERRELLKLGLVGAGSLILPSALMSPAMAAPEGPVPMCPHITTRTFNHMARNRPPAILACASCAAIEVGGVMAEVQGASFVDELPGHPGLSLKTLPSLGVGDYRNLGEAVAALGRTGFQAVADPADDRIRHLRLGGEPVGTILFVRRGPRGYPYVTFSHQGTAWYEEEVSDDLAAAVFGIMEPSPALRDRAVWRLDKDEQGRWSPAGTLARSLNSGLMAFRAGAVISFDR